MKIDMYDIKIEEVPVRWEGNQRMNNPYQATWTWQAMRRLFLIKGCPLGTGVNSSEAIVVLITRTNRESGTNFQCSDVIPGN